MADGPINQSFWVATARPTAFPRLSGDLSVDVAIVGGGLVGVTAARLLKNEGLSVAVIEARRVGQQVTGKSTAKVTSQHNLKYAGLAKSFGEEGARIYADANEAGVGMIRRLVSQHRIACDLEDRPAFTYTLDSKHVSAIEEEVRIARSLCLPASLTQETGLPFDVLAAMRWDNQAQFHPVDYVAGLAATIPGEGCHVFEGSRAVDWHPDRVATENGTISARHVIMATHMPLGQIGFLYAEAYPWMHPVIVGHVDPGRAPEGMSISVEQPRHSVRSHRDADGGTWAILTGPSFKPGEVEEERKAFAEIERFALDRFAVRPAYRWTNEDYEPIDGKPFVGRSSSLADFYLVATGFNAWGISTGTAAAMILTDIVAGRDNPWARFFDSARVDPARGGKQFLKGTADVAKHLIGGYASKKPGSIDVLAPGEAAVLKIDGENVAAYRDEQGRVHAVSAACTHMGCLLGWNENDRTWDCHCHGSRFDLAGAVIHGPAVAPLAPRLTGAPDETRTLEEERR